MKNNNSLYYVATVKRELCWLLSTVVRGTENVAFVRALDKEKNLFEFFVPEPMEPVFEQMIAYLRSEGIILSLEKKENRLITEKI